MIKQHLPARGRVLDDKKYIKCPVRSNRTRVDRLEKHMRLVL